VKTVKDYMKKRMGDKFGFKFPKNGWTCRSCQNYNFPQRGSCMRCKKVKTEADVDGMPNHLKNKSFFAKPSAIFTPEKSESETLSVNKVQAFIPTFGHAKAKHHTFKTQEAELSDSEEKTVIVNTLGGLLSMIKTEK